MITCGNCKGQHRTPDAVRKCYGERGVIVRREPEPPKRELPKDGYYTIVFDDEADERITIRLRTQDDDSTFAPGKQIAAYLAGPDNEMDYINFAFTNGDHGEVRAYIWKRFRANTRLDRALNHLLRNPIDAGEAYALESGRCWRCGRRLTVPASIHRGLGPECAKKVGS